MTLRLERNALNQYRVTREDAPGVWTVISEVYDTEQEAAVARDRLIGESTWEPVDTISATLARTAGPGLAGPASQAPSEPA